MNITIQCLTSQRIFQLRADELPPEELAQIEEHLGECPKCQRLLDDAAADAQEWGDLRESLGGEQFAEADPPGHCDFDSDETSLDHVLKLLGPTDDPRMLGRIGPYEIVGVLGRGGMGVVFKGFDGALNRYVAIKMLLPHMASTGAARKRFAREAQAAAAVVDEHVMAIHGVAEWQGIPYLVMPYTRGVSLQKRLADQGPLELREILRIGTQAASGLAAAHAQGLVHRDVKPANILLADGVERVTLVDFGLARAIDDVGLTRTGVLAGTPQYMSPEQARGQTLDARSDLFCLGSVLYATCTGRAPFRAESSYGVLRLITDEEPRPIRELNPDVPDWLCGIIGRLMAKQPGDRFASAAEVAKLLEACLAHVQQPTAVALPLAVRQQQPLAKGERKASDSWWHLSPLISILTIAALAAGGLFAMLLWQATDPPDIGGSWSSTEWGRIELVAAKPGEYLGEYTQTHTETPGQVRLAWSRVERRFNGAWSEGPDIHGEVSLRLVEGEIRGSFTTDASSKLEPGVKPKLGDLRFVRVKSKAVEGQDAVLALEAFSGDWEVESAQGVGNPPPLEGLFSFRDNKFTHRKQGKIDMSGTLEVDPSKSPPTFLLRYSEFGHVAGTYQFHKDGSLWLKIPDTDVRPRPEGPQPDRLLRLRHVPIAAAKKEDDPPSVITHNMRIRNADGSAALFNDVVEANIGYPHAGLPKWEASPNREGVVSLEKLPVGTHWLLAAGNGERRTVFKVVTPMRVTLPTGKFGNQPPAKDPAKKLAELAGIPVDQLLRRPRAWASKDLEIKPSVVIDERDREFGEIIVIEIKNMTKEALIASEEDVQLRTELNDKFHESVLVLSPGFASEDRTPFSPITIEPGQSGALRINWQQWAKSGIWARRTGPISEPGLPPAEPGRMWLRVGLGNAGFHLVSVRRPKATGLEFLAGYPKLREFSLDMTEEQFQALALQNDLAISTRPVEPLPGKPVTASYHLELGDGLTLVVMFRGGKCSGMQRIRGGEAKTPLEEKVPKPADSTKEYQNFEGTWRILERTENGVPVKLEFGAGGMHVIQDRQMGEAKISLDPGQSPREIDIAFIKGPDKGKLLRGIYEWVEVEGSPRFSRLRISVSTKLSDPGLSDDHRPKDFEARKGIDFAVWERTKAGAAPAKAAPENLP